MAVETIRLTGLLDVAGAARAWGPVMARARAARGGPLVLDIAGVEAVETAGAVLLLAAERAHGGAVTIAGAGERAAALLARVRGLDVAPPPGPAPPAPGWGAVLRAALAVMLSGIAYLGEAAVAAARLPARRRMFRLADLGRFADAAGVQALPLVLLLGVLVGVILAFQSLIPMRRFGADIYVANLVAISLARELGPLLTAVILAGRSGSAFAAEIGTMKVNQELDALATMGVDAMTMLVLPRLLAAVVVTPLLAVVMELAGTLGMTLVLVASGVPLSVVMQQVAWMVVPRDFFGGLFKAALFGAAVAAIGCRAGLSTTVGPRAVGLAATSAVVGGIVATIALDGLMAVLFYRLGL